MFLERYVEQARHIEVQIFGDGSGEVIALGERDCSDAAPQSKNDRGNAGRRTCHRRAARRLHATRRATGRGRELRSAGTVEFVYDAERAEFYFLEVNTRLQVEHGVTEEVTGIDMVEWMIRQAAEERLRADRSPHRAGASIQVRLYAEDPARGFRPSSGLLTRARFPRDARVETWVEDGTRGHPVL